MNRYQRPSFFGGFSFFPPVIKTLLISNAAIFLVTLFLGNFRLGDFTLGGFLFRLFALFPLEMGFQPWQLFTYMFMHADFMHIFFNMFALWMFGMELENTWGSKKFLIYYILCGLGGGVANLFVAPLFTQVAPTIGASGAVYGILLAFGMMFPDRLIYIYFLLPIKAKYFVIFYMVLEIISVGSSDGIAHIAHLGGALIGLLFLMLDKNSLLKFNTPKIFTSQKQSTPSSYSNISDVQSYDIENHKKNEDEISQQKVDEILDKISRGGYQSLTEEEKKILFEASKKLH